MLLRTGRHPRRGVFLLHSSCRGCRYAVLGWSDGANSAVHLAARHPDRVTRLAVWGANVDMRLADFEASSVGCNDGRGVELWGADRSAGGDEYEEKQTMLVRATRMKSLAKELRWELQTFRESTAAQFDGFRAYIRAMDWKFQEMRAELHAGDGPEAVPVLP